MITYRNDAGCISKDLSTKCIEITIYKTVETDNFVLLMQAAIATFHGMKARYPLAQVLVDCNMVEVMSEQDLKWVETYILELLLTESGVRYIALVPPKRNIEGMGSFIEKAQEMHIVKLQRNTWEAKQWLKRKNAFLKFSIRRFAMAN